MELMKDLTDFRKQIEENTEEVVNYIINTLPNTPSKNFKSKYGVDFSWASLTSELKKYDYCYVQDKNTFIKKASVDEVSLFKLSKENIDSQKYSKRVNFYLSEKTHAKMEELKQASGLSASAFYDTLVNYACDRINEKFKEGDN